MAKMIGAGMVIDEALTVREVTGQVSEVTWGKVQGLSATVAYTQGFAMLQLKALAERLEGESKVRKIAKATGDAYSEAQDWLAVLARCSQLASALEVLELDRVFAVSPGIADDHRRGLRLARQNRLDLIAQHTNGLLDRIDASVGTANAKALWNRTQAATVVQSGNLMAANVQDFHETLGIESDARHWAGRELEGAAAVGAQTIQFTRDAAPAAAAVGALALAAAVALGNRQEERE